MPRLAGSVIGARECEPSAPMQVSRYVPAAHLMPGQAGRVYQGREQGQGRPSRPRCGGGLASVYIGAEKEIMMGGGLPSATMKTLGTTHRASDL
jgi:hypothetical protein